MSLIDELLSIDLDNTGRWRENFRKFDRSLPEAFDTGAEMFRTFARCMEGQIHDAEEYRVLEEYARNVGSTADQVIERLKAAEEISDSDPLKPAEDAYFRVRARRARAVVLLLLERSFLWGATDLLRMRLTSAAGYSRLEAECVGLLLLMREDPAVGDRWWKVTNEEEGRAFFTWTQPNLKERLRSIGLAFAYEHGSAGAQHVRVLSAIDGLSWSGTHARLVYQEAREEDPFSFFLGVLSFLSTQVRVFHALKKAFPEVTDPIWDQRVKLFNIDVARLWERLEKHFPARCKEIEERNAQSSLPVSS